jgi:predicted membrane-bound spermidine synthase
VLAALAGSERLTSLAEDGLYADEIVFARQTPYQRIVLTRGRGSFQLFLNGNLQFSSADEYRYHEALVHPALSLAPGARRVLVLGGGDGLAARELLKYPGVEEIVLVDLDAEMVRAARENPLLVAANKGAMLSPKVKVANEDAYLWVQRDHGTFDAAIVDFPDPNNFALGKLYTTRFYKLLRRLLAPDAPLAVQSTSPLMARRSFWCVVRTLEDSGLATRPYHAFVPSFGEWGFVLARAQAFEVPTRLQVQDLSWLTEESLPTLFAIPRDMAPLPVEVNRLNNQARGAVLRGGVAAVELRESVGPATGLLGAPRGIAAGSSSPVGPPPARGAGHDAPRLPHSGPGRTGGAGCRMQVEVRGAPVRRPAAGERATAWATGSSAARTRATAATSSGWACASSAEGSPGSPPAGVC